MAFGCEHGIGHGVIANIGYTYSDLTKALDLCSGYETIKLPYTLQPCPDGVFMEYFLHQLASTDASGNFVPLTFTESGKFGPCMEVSDRYQIDCAYELPTWWYFSPPVMALSDPWQTMGKYCTELPSQLSSYCIKSIGFMLAEDRNLDANAIREGCTAATTNDQDRLFCYVGAVRRYTLLNASDADVTQACKTFGLSERDQVRCAENISIDEAGSE